MAEEKLNGKPKPTTQIHRFIDFPWIKLIAASTSQAKGRIECLLETLQDRLVTEFKLNNISTIEQANFLTKYIEKYNKKFASILENKNSKFVSIPSYID